MSIILRFVLPIILIFIGAQFVRDYTGDTTKDQKAKLEQLVSQGVDGMAAVSNDYVEKTTKIAGVPIKTYEATYTFKVDGKDYAGTQSLNEPPTEPVVKIKYMPSNPTINAANPVADLATINEGKGISTLLIGLGLILAGLGLGYFRYRSSGRA